MRKSGRLAGPAHSDLLLRTSAAGRHLLERCPRWEWNDCPPSAECADIGCETLVRRLWPDTGAAVPPSTHRRRPSDVKSALRAIGSHENWLVVLGDKVARATRKVPRTSVVPEVQSGTVAASSSTERSTVNSAREMTRASHFCVPSTSYAEQSFLKKLNETGHSPRNDVAGTIL